MECTGLPGVECTAFGAVSDRILYVFWLTRGSFGKVGEAMLYKIRYRASPSTAVRTTLGVMVSLSSLERDGLFV